MTLSTMFVPSSEKLKAMITDAERRCDADIEQARLRARSVVTTLSRENGVTLVECGGYKFRVAKTKTRNGRWRAELADADNRPQWDNGDRSCDAWTWLDELNRGFFRNTRAEALTALSEHMAKTPDVVLSDGRPILRRDQPIVDWIGRVQSSKISQLIAEAMPITYNPRTKAAKAFNLDVAISGYPQLFELAVDRRVYVQLRWRQRSNSGLWRVVVYTPGMPEGKSQWEHQISWSTWTRSYPDLVEISQETQAVAA